MEPINVTKTFLPPKSEYLGYLDQAWDKGWITNNGPLVKELENRLKAYLNVPRVSYVNNGTIALQIAIKALGLKGEIITTPFSYVATTSSIVWEGCKPVFVDIDPNSFNIDPTKIEAAITPNTSAILATHVYGNPCDIEMIEAIAQKHNLRVIYDAAHCFGVVYKGKSIFNYGDISITSFHATKLFHTVEGGAIFAQSEEVAEKVHFMRNFGHNGPGNFNGVGINGKNSEFHAAMGLANLKYIEAIISDREKTTLLYDKLLPDTLQRPHLRQDTVYNFAYYPVIFPSEEQLLSAEKVLHEKNIFPRRYFYPSLNKLDYVGGQSTCVVSEDIAARVLCLPLYFGLAEDDVRLISKTIDA